MVMVVQVSAIFDWMLCEQTVEDDWLVLICICSVSWAHEQTWSGLCVLNFGTDRDFVVIISSWGECHFSILEWHRNDRMFNIYTIPYNTEKSLDVVTWHFSKINHGINFSPNSLQLSMIEWSIWMEIYSHKTLTHGFKLCVEWPSARRYSVYIEK